MASIHTIAKMAGVSASTVSRALNGTGYCAPETREKILKIADELNYVPSLSARALKTKRNSKVMVCIPDICNPYYFHMIEGINEVLDAADYLPILCPTQGSLTTELRMLQLLQEGYGDGLIFISFDYNDQNVQAIQKSNRPVVVTNRIPHDLPNRNFDLVFVDTYKGIRLATRALIEEGYQKIFYLGGDPQKQTGRERLRGFLDEMEAHSREVPEERLLEGDFTLDSGSRAMRKALDQGLHIEALVVANDLMAVGAQKVCMQEGVPVPVTIGMDNGDMSEAFGFSSVKMQEHQIGLEAATLLLSRIRGNQGPAVSVRLEPELELRTQGLGHYMA